MSTPGCEYCHNRAQLMDGRDGVHVTKHEELINQLEQLAPHPTVDGDWQEVTRHIPVDLEATARESRALLRHRGVRRAEDLLRMALAYALCDWSLRLVAAWACLKGWADLSDTALMYRLRGARPWMGSLVAALVITNRCELAGYPVRVRLVDASVVNGPGSKGTDWRVHLSLDLGQGRIDGVEVTDSKGGETLVRHPAQPGEILIADRGYGHANGIGRVLARGAKLIQRITLRNMRLYDEKGEKLDLLEWLRQAPEIGAVERQVWIKAEDGTFPVRLIAKRLSEQAAEAARRRLRRQSQKNGRTPDKRSLEMAGYITVVSNLDEPIWTPGQVMALYRLRWQVETAFKRLKGVLDLDHLRAQDPDLAQTYLLSKLLGALMVDRIGRVGPTVSIEWFESVERPVSPWRWLVLWSDALRRAVQGTLALAELLFALPRLQRYLCDATRRRRQQYALGRRLMQILAGMAGTTHHHIVHTGQLLQPMALS
jgi:hypothetical protein